MIALHLKITNSKETVNNMLNMLAEVMAPVILPMTVAGLVSGVLALLNALGMLAVESNTYIIFDTIRSAVFYFFPIYIAISSAKEFGVEQSLAITLAVILLSANINGVKNLTLFGISLPEITYSSTFIPIFLGVYCMHHCNRLFNKIITKSLKGILVPLLTISTALVGTLLIFGPLGSVISEGLSIACLWLMEEFGNATVICVYALLHPFMVLTGCNSLVLPIIFNNMSTLGYDPMLIVGITLSNIAICGSMLGCFLKEKKLQKKQQYCSSGFSAAMGIPIPAIFNVLIHQKYTLLSVMFSGAAAGLLAGFLHVKGYVFVASIPGLTTYLMGNDQYNFYSMLIASGIALLLSCMIAFATHRTEIDKR